MYAQNPNSNYQWMMELNGLFTFYLYILIFLHMLPFANLRIIVLDLGQYSTNPELIG